MTYADLLQESYEQDFTANVPENDTFAAIDAFMTENFNFILDESAFEVKFGIQDIIFEADETAEGEAKKKIDIKGTAKNVGAAVVATLKKVLEAIQKFFGKIGEAVSRVVSKANAVVSTKAAGGQFARVNSIKVNYPDAFFANACTIYTLDEGKVGNILNKFKSASEKITSFDANSVKESDLNSVIEVLDVFDKNITAVGDNADGSHVHKWEIDAKAKVDAYIEKIRKTNNELSKAVDILSKNTKDSVKALKKIESQIKKIVDKPEDADAAKAATCSKLARAIMKSSTAAMKLVADIAKMIAKDCNTIAANAAVEKDGKVTKIYKNSVSKNDADKATDKRAKEVAKAQKKVDKDAANEEY